VIVNSDGGSTDGTPEAVLSAHTDYNRLLTLTTPVLPVDKVSLPYHGVPGQGSALRLIFRLAQRLKAKACVVLDAGLRSVTPEWIDLLARPVLYAGQDFVAPDYHRHKYDGTITNCIVYPFTRALYGLRVRPSFGGDFGFSARLIDRYLDRSDWESDVARSAVDTWLTTIAMAERFRVCQSFLGPRVSGSRGPSPGLSTVLQQVLGSVFALMEEYAAVWPQVSGSEPADLFGYRFDTALDPVPACVAPMIDAFRRGCHELHEVWSLAFEPETMASIRDLAHAARHETFYFPDELWCQALIELACVYHRRPIERAHLLRSLTPLYLARVASFAIETRDLVSAEVDQKIEHLCQTFERMKPLLISRWEAETSPQPESKSRRGLTSRAFSTAQAAGTSAKL
jgi:hypothetical protein